MRARQVQRLLYVVGKKKGSGKSAATGGKVDELERLSKDELLRMLREAHISPQRKGSQPTGSKAGAKGSDVGESSSSGEQSSSSSSSSSGSASLSLVAGTSRKLSHQPRVNSTPSWAL